MQGKAANHSTDNPIFRGRIGAQTLLPAAEESQQLAGKNIDHGEIFITQSSQSGTLEHRIALASQLLRHIFANQYLG